MVGGRNLGLGFADLIGGLRPSRKAVARGRQSELFKHDRRPLGHYVDATGFAKSAP